MKSKIQHVFFDLDRTLWDFEKSAWDTFKQIFTKYNLLRKGIPSVDKFHEVYTIHNDILWEKYRNGAIEKEQLKCQRFTLTLKDFNIDDSKLGEDIGNDYVKLSPLTVNLFPNTIEILEYLYPKYKLHIITNGFSEVQDIKLRSAKLDSYFKEVITSEAAGVKKPDKEIFKYAFERSGASANNSIMIGDDYKVDIVGAKKVGMKQIFFDPNNRYAKYESTYYINDLIEITDIL